MTMAPSTALIISVASDGARPAGTPISSSAPATGPVQVAKAAAAAERVAAEVPAQSTVAAATGQPAS